MKKEISRRINNSQPSKKRRKHSSSLPLKKLRRITHIVEHSWLNQKRWYLLYNAVVAKNVRQAKFVLDLGANVNLTIAKHDPVLHCAARADDLKMVKLFVKAGAEVNKRINDGKSALHFAVTGRNEAMIHYLLNNNSSIDAKDNKGNTPLHTIVDEYIKERGVQHRNIAIMKILLEHGADPNEPDEWGTTPFHTLVAARDNADVTAVSLFLKHRADVTKTNVFGRTALHFAATSRDSKKLELILDKGAEINKKDLTGNTALHTASITCHAESIRLLVARGADVNVKNDLNHTPLYECLVESDRFEQILFPVFFQEHRLQTIQSLLDLGSDLNLKFTSDNNKTIIELAMHREQLELCNTMIKHAAMVEARENKQLLDMFNVMEMHIHLQKSKIYYEACHAELVSMKENRIGDTSVSYFSVLVNPLHMVIGYARNQELVQAFKSSNYSTKFPIYQAQLRAKFDEAIWSQKLREKAATVLSDTFRFAHPTHLTFDIILRYLTNDDMGIIIDNA